MPALNSPGNPISALIFILLYDKRKRILDNFSESLNDATLDFKMIAYKLIPKSPLYDEIQRLPRVYGFVFNGNNPFALGVDKDITRLLYLLDKLIRYLQE